MNTLKKRMKKRVNKRGRKILTKSDLTKITDVLPYNYRQTLFKTCAGITFRQITDVVYQRTTNVKDNLLVWQTINEALSNMNRPDLVQLVQKPLFYYTNLYNTIQNASAKRA